MQTISWRLYEFIELPNTMLYEIMVVRQEVFVVEQNCSYLDADGYDPQAVHLCGVYDEKIVAYSRIFPPNVKYVEVSIGRVLTTQDARRKGVGKELMQQAIAYCRQRYPKSTIRISAQSYLEKFYCELGFSTVGVQYLEDGIPHQEMIYHA